MAYLFVILIIVVISILTLGGEGAIVTITAWLGEPATFRIPHPRQCHNYVLYDPDNVAVFRANKYGSNLKNWATYRADFLVSDSFINFTIHSIQQSDQGEYTFLSGSNKTDPYCVRVFQLEVVKAVDGGWTEWSNFGPCSVTCGLGTKTRSRNCTAPKPQNGGNYCPENGTETQQCQNRHCPVDGGWTEWSNFGSCSATCGPGTKVRSRSCTAPRPQDGGSDCTGYNTESKLCQYRECPVDGGWGEWSEYGGCSQTCGEGRRTRWRRCNSPTRAHGGYNCQGPPTEKMACNLRTCPVDGGWTQWSEFGKCSVLCNTGTQTRTRTCSNPIPEHGGKRCDGSETERVICNDFLCPVVSSWSDWWTGSCSVSCGEGIRNLTRECLPGENTADIYNCTGEAFTTEPCSEALCPIDGSWSPWGIFDACSTTCGPGMRTRIRNCSEPSPQYGGKFCPGDRKLTELCNDKECPVDGAWSAWSTWTSCLMICGKTVQNRTRECDRPVPQYGGQTCQGNNTQSKQCPGKVCETTTSSTNQTIGLSIEIIAGVVVGGVVVAIVIIIVVVLRKRKKIGKRDINRNENNREPPDMGTQCVATITNQTYFEPEEDNSNIYWDISDEPSGHLTSCRPEYQQISESCRDRTENTYLIINPSSDDPEMDNSVPCSYRTSQTEYLTPTRSQNENFKHSCCEDDDIMTPACRASNDYMTPVGRASNSYITPVGGPSIGYMTPLGKDS